MATSKRSSVLNYKFIDQSTSSKYACTLCYSVPREPLKAQCCGATYCELCAAGHTEFAELSVSASQSTGDPLLSQSIKVCANCESKELQLLPDSALVKNIGKLRVECPIEGCGWVGEVTGVEAHMAEPHDDLEDELYANDFADQPETTQSEQSWAQQYRKAHTPSIRSPQPPSSRYQGIPMLATTDEGHETLAVTPQPLSTRQQFQIEQELPSPTKRNQVLCCRSQGFADLSTSEKLLYIASFLTTSLWILLVIPTSVIVLLSSINKVRNESASFAPSCDYSVALLWLVILVHIIVAVCSIVWFGRCCKPCKKKRMRRAALSILCVIALLYAMVVVGFAVSVFPFVNQSSDSDSQSDTGDTMGPQSSGSGSGSGVSASGSGDNVASAEGVSGEGGSGEGGCGEGGSGEIGSGGSGSGDIELENGSICDKSMNETNNRTLDNEMAEETICIEISSEPFILALVFLGLLCVFVVAMLCIVSYECSRNGFCYRKTQYDPTVTVIENMSSVIA